MRCDCPCHTADGDWRDNEKCYCNWPTLTNTLTKLYEKNEKKK